MSGFRELSESECRARLVECQTGRVAITAPDGPHVIPVNYALVDECVVFRTGRSTVLGTYAPGATIAFEVEHTDDVTRSGWSVVARGPASLVVDVEQLEHIRRIWEPSPWAGGDRPLHLVLSVRELSGRVVGDELVAHRRAGNFGSPVPSGFVFDSDVAAQGPEGAS